MFQILCLFEIAAREYCFRLTRSRYDSQQSIMQVAISTICQSDDHAPLSAGWSLGTIKPHFTRVLFVFWTGVP